jgi:cytoskeleton protein RodZ
MSQPVSEDSSRPAEAHSADHPRTSFGAWLRHQREARSVSMREIADNSKISLRYLEALEQDRFDVLPAPVFARGFLREYARVVGLNPDEVVNLYIVAQEERAEGGKRPERPASARMEGAGAAPSSLGYGLLLGLAVVLFVGIAALLSFLAERRKTPPPESKLVAPTTMSPPAAAPSQASPTAHPDGAPAAVAAGGGGEIPAGGAALDTPAGAEPLAGPLRVVLNFSQDCWMETVVDGNRRTAELKAAGETVQIEAEQSVLLTLGNSRAVTVEVDGVPLALPENATRVVRDFRIERAAAPPPKPAEPQAPSATSAPPVDP